MGALFGRPNNSVDDIYVDFANAQPNDDEKETYERTTELLAIGEEVIADFNEYKDCADSIRRALSNPSDQNEQYAFDEVRQNVSLLYRIYTLTKDLSEVFGSIVTRLADMGDEKSAMEENQASARLFCDILSLVMTFDEVKMRKPGLQNDFSYYRRNLLKHADEDLLVKDQEANFVSLFYAPASPMMYHLAQGLRDILQDETVANNVTILLATIANVCLHLVKTEASEDNNINLLLVRAMVATIVLYDHSVPNGVFCNSSGVNIKGAVSLVCKQYSEHLTLVNALRYSTIHYNDDSTPNSIASILEAFD